MNNQDKKAKKKKENKMRKINMASVVLHCSTADQAALTRAEKLLAFITKAKPVRTLAKKRIPAWKIRPGLALGCKVTLRGKRAVELLKRLFAGISQLNKEQFNQGFLSFGIKEYIQVPSIPFQREIGIIGFDVVATLKRPGYRIVKRRLARAKIKTSHKISKDETIEFFKKNFDINIEK